MKKIIFVIAAIGLMLILSGCAPSVYVNHKYEFGNKYGLKLALIPIENESGLIVDPLMYDIFSYLMPGPNALLPPDEIRWRLKSDKDLGEILKKIRSVKYSSAELKNSPSLSSILSSGESATLYGSLDSSDVMLIPVRFDMNKSLLFGGEKANFTFRLYDLTSGTMVYERSGSFEFREEGEGYRRYLRNLLIYVSGADFKNYFLFPLYISGNNNYESKAYKYDDPGPRKLAIIPMMDEESIELNWTMQHAFRNLPEGDSLIPISVLKDKIKSKDDIAIMIGRVMSYRYRKTEMEAPSIDAILSADEKLILKDMLESADLVMVPVDYFTGIDDKSAAGTVRYRLYDLNSGELVFDYADYVDFRANSKTTTETIADSLSARAFLDYKKYFLDKCPILSPEGNGVAR